MVVRRWFVEGRKLFGIFAPVKIARVNNEARNSRPMATNPLGARMGYYICAVLNGAYKISAATKCVVNLEVKTRESVSFKFCAAGNQEPYNQWYVIFVCQVCKRFKVRNIRSWIADTFNI
jgi:hypothetical protein